MAASSTAVSAFSRVIVFGAGALGCLVGGKLSRRKLVALVTRGAHLAALQSHGLRLAGLSDATIPMSAQLCAVERLSELVPGLQPRDLLILVVKALQSQEAAITIAEAARVAGATGVTVLGLQNGTGYEDDVRRLLGDRVRLVLGVAFAGATLREPGVVEDWGGELFLPSEPAFQALAEDLTAGGQPANAVADVEMRRWQKIVFNCALNAFCVLLNARNNETVRPEWRTLRRAILHEGRALALTRQVRLPEADELLEAFEHRALTSRNVNSMLQDIQRGRPTEIDFLNGAIERLARERGEPAPANAAVARWIRRFEATPADAHDALRAEAVRDLQTVYG